MVKGLDVFRNHFMDYGDRYVLIGGTACDLAMEEAGLPFRVTRDLDIVLCIEALDSEFVRVGGYQVQQQSTGKKQFYRFLKPENINFPAMLELFSRKPDMLILSGASQLVPISANEDASSLSVTLLNEEYYEFILSGKHQINGMTVIGADRLIPLKARAWIDLSERKERGEDVDGKTIRKHKNDIFRLYQIVDPGKIIETPAVVATDLRNFIGRISDDPIDLKVLGLGATSMDSILGELRRIYGIS